MDIQRYLERISYSGNLSIDASTLKALAIAHQRSVPFENLDNHLLLPSTLDVDLFYEKIVVQGRGGWCYELNGLFGSLLRGLGYRVDYLAARVFGRGYEGRNFSHLCLRVGFDDESYLADVGFGQNFHEPLEWRDGAAANYLQSQFRLSLSRDCATLESIKDNEFDTGYRISLKPRQLKEFERTNDFLMKDAGSILSRNLIVTRTTRDGRVSLIGNRLVRRAGDSIVETDISNEKEAIDTLKREFGVVVDRFPKPKSQRITMRIRYFLRRVSLFIERRIKSIYQRS